MRVLIVSIWLRCILRELRLDVSDLPRQIAGRGERLSCLASLAGEDPIGIGSCRQPVDGWVSIGAGLRLFDIPAVLGLPEMDEGLHGHYTAQPVVGLSRSSQNSVTVVITREEARAFPTCLRPTMPLTGRSARW